MDQFLLISSGPFFWTTTKSHNTKSWCQPPSFNFQPSKENWSAKIPSPIVDMWGRVSEKKRGNASRINFWELTCEPPLENGKSSTQKVSILGSGIKSVSSRSSGIESHRYMAFLNGPFLTQNTPSYSPAIAGLKLRRKLALVKGCLGRGIVRHPRPEGWDQLVVRPLQVMKKCSKPPLKMTHTQQISRNHLSPKLVFKSWIPFLWRDFFLGR